MMLEEYRSVLVRILRHYIGKPMSRGYAVSYHLEQDIKHSNFSNLSFPRPV